ncbi:MAG: GEVED domain-containing protein [Bacteroidales bacterium]
MISNGKDVAVLENHSGDSFANVYSNTRNSYYATSGTPTAYFDGILTVVGGNHTQSMYGSYLPKYNQRKAILSDFTIDIQASTDDYQTCEVVIDVNKVAGSYGSLKLYVAVSESGIPYSWQGMSVLNHVNRLMVPNQNGTDLNFTSQSNYQVTLPFTLNSSWVYENCELSVFLQNYATKEIYQAVKLSMNDFNHGVVADFTVDNQQMIAGESALFTDLSSGDPVSWFWEFEGGTPATYSGQNPPAITYSAPGLYDVTLTASDGTENDIETKTDYIEVTSYCAAIGATNFLAINLVQIETINNASGQEYYSDYTYLSTDLTINQWYDITIENSSNYLNGDLGIWVDWNQNNSFNDDGENVVCSINNYGEGTFNFQVPAGALTGPTTMRIRTKFNGSDCGDPCGATIYGEVEDYTLNIIPALLPPVAGFIADNLLPEIGETVSFIDLSENNPDTWEWGFTPATVSYTGGTNSNSQYPQVQFNESGLYTASLTVTNSGGTDMETKTDYIDVHDPVLSLDITVFCEGPFNGSGMAVTINGSVPLAQPYGQAPWNYPGNESVSEMPANIVDWVLVELRDAIAPELATADHIIARQAALLRNDGKIVAPDGISPVDFVTSYTDGLFTVIHHRNHLSVMSATTLTENGGIYAWNFTTGETMAHGGMNAQNQIGAGIWGMISGDYNADGIINSDDIDFEWKTWSGWQGYLNSDSNFDGQVNNVDKNDFNAANLSKSTQVP